MTVAADHRLIATGDAEAAVSGATAYGLSVEETKQVFTVLNNVLDAASQE